MAQLHRVQKMGTQHDTYRVSLMQMIVLNDVLVCIPVTQATTKQRKLNGICKLCALCTVR